MKELIVLESDIRVESRTARRFLLCFAIVVSFALLSLMLVSIYVNPYGDFGDTGYFVLRNDRLAKVRYLLAESPDKLPEAWVMGSSNSQPFQPSSIEARFGFTAFNLGVFWGRLDESWTWLNFLLRDLNTHPKMIILCVEPWSFGSDGLGPRFYPHIRRRLLNTPQLRKYLDEYHPIKLFLSRAFTCFSYQNIRHMKETVVDNKRYRYTLPLLGSSRSLFLADGTNKFYNGSEPENKRFGDYNESYVKLQEMGIRPEEERFRRAMAHFLTDSSPDITRREVLQYLPKDTMREEKLDLLRRFVEKCQDKSIPLAVVMMPSHPYFYDFLVDRTNHARNLEVLKGYLTALSSENSVLRVTDASHIGLFNGDPRLFHDRQHMTPANCDRLLNLVKKQWDEAE